MRIIINKDEASCMFCGVDSHAVLLENGSVVCSNCMSANLVSHYTGGAFQAVFGDKTYRVNQYCPDVKDRRLINRSYPIFKERRGLHGSLQVGLGRP